MLYNLHELKHAMTTPLRLQATLMRSVFSNPLNPWSETQVGRAISANATMIIRATRKFERPEFGLSETIIGGKTVKIEEDIIEEKTFCSLLNFKRKTKRNDPKVLVVAPMSGHYATLLRGTVDALLPHHDVYITDWEDARQIPTEDGGFSLDDYITYIRDFLSLLGPETHVIAVCQPAVPVLAAIALMASDNDPNQPLTMTLMGGPIDTRVSKTEVTELAEKRPLSWFEDNVLYDVPFNYEGANRRVYPGFLQLSGFMSMNLETHVGSHADFYQHLINGDDDSVERHKKFYNEYLSVMDLDEEFYLQTIEEVFQKHSLPRGKMKWRNPLTGKLIDVRPQDIKHTALLTVEGELDDISARGQTTAAHSICYSLPQYKQFHHFQEKCGHYGIFNGGRWRNQISPRLRNFIRKFDTDKDPIPKVDLQKIPDLAPAKYNHDLHGIVAVRRWLKEYQPDNYKNTKITSLKPLTKVKSPSTAKPKVSATANLKLVPPTKSVVKPKILITAELVDKPAAKTPKKKIVKATTKPKVKKPASTKSKPKAKSTTKTTPKTKKKKTTVKA